MRCMIVSNELRSADSNCVAPLKININDVFLQNMRLSATWQKGYK